jgi:hypothetical protein
MSSQHATGFVLTREGKRGAVFYASLKTAGRHATTPQAREGMDEAHAPPCRLPDTRHG